MEAEVDEFRIEKLVGGNWRGRISDIHDSFSHDFDPDVSHPLKRKGPKGPMRGRALRIPYVPYPHRQKQLFPKQ